MPNWKKVIVSGSDAALNSLNVTTSLTASGLIYPTVDGTAGQVLTTNGAGSLSFSSSSISASYAITASYAIFAETASSALNAQDILILVKNQSGAPIAKGVVVRITGSNNASDIPRVITASYENDNNSANTLGITNQSIANGADGFVMTEGVLKGINTNAFVSGQLIYLGATGSIIGYAPVAPLHSVRLGEVVREQSNNGSIYVRIDNGYELGELHDVVDTTTTSSYGDLLVKSGSVWTNSRQLTGSYGLTGSLTATSFTGSLFGTASWAINALTASYTPSIAGTDNYIPRFNGSSALENSVMYDDGTNIGIGTTNPSYTLDISGQVAQILSNNSSFTAWYIGNTGTGHAQTYYDGINGDFSGLDYGFVGQNNAGYMEYYVGSLSPNPSHVFSSGNVGIGITNPAAKLHVSGSVSASIFYPFNAGGNYIQGDGTGLVAGGPSYFYSAGSGGSYFEGQVRIRGALANDTAAYMQINGGTSNYTYINGSLGIGTTTPSTTLSLAGATATTFGLSLTPNGWNGAKHRFTVPTSGDTSMWSFNWDGSTTDASYATSAITLGQGLITFATTGSANTPAERMRIDGNGNVGIGTTSPTSNLQVQSNNLSAPAFAVSKSFSGGGDGTAVMHAFGFDSGIANTGIQVGVKGTGGFSATDAYPFRVFNQGTAVFDVKSNNGIKFNSYGSGTFTGTATQKLAVDSSGNVIEIPIGAGPVDGSGTANYITRWVDTDTITTSSIYETGGNIGIGTTSPNNPLHIFTSNVSGSFEVSGFQSAGSPLTFLESNYGGGNAVKIKFLNYNPSNGFDSDFGIQLMNASQTMNDVFIIKGSTGNVGIGTTSPAYKLSVVGKMALNDGGDSVFVGNNAGQSDDATANVNVGIGTNALQTNISGSGNVGVGSNALQYSTAQNNTAVGNNASRFTTTGFSNTSLGSFALWQNLDGIENTGLGTTALLSNTSGSGNTGVGTNALRANTSGSNNTGVGVSALSANILGNDNVAIGRSAGRFFGTGTSTNTSASGSIFIGLTSRANASGEENQIVIGMNALGLGSNSVVLGNDNIIKTVLKGNVGIGTNVPMGPLEIYKSNPAGLGGHLILNNDGSSVGNETAILFNDGGTGSVGFIRAAISSTTEGSPFNGDIKFKTGNTSYGSLSTRMIITGAGNVGIGTTSPGVKLEVYDSANANAVTITSDGANQQLVIRRYSSTNEQLIFGVHSSDYSYIQAVEQGVAYRALSLNPDGGNVGIGTTNPAYLLDVNGTARVTTLIETSALKYKTNIQPLDSQLSKVAQLEPVTFDWIDKPNPKTNIGLIADEVEKIYPEFVSKTEDGEIEGIEYSKLTTVLIQSIKELKEIVDQQQAQINKLLSK